MYILKQLYFFLWKSYIFGNTYPTENNLVIKKSYTVIQKFYHLEYIDKKPINSLYCTCKNNITRFNAYSGRSVSLLYAQLTFLSLMFMRFTL